MTVLIFGVYFKTIDIKNWRRNPVKMGAEGELLAAMEIENTQECQEGLGLRSKQTLFISHCHNQIIGGDC